MVCGREIHSTVTQEKASTNIGFIFLGECWCKRNKQRYVTYRNAEIFRERTPPPAHYFKTKLFLSKCETNIVLVFPMKLHSTFHCSLFLQLLTMFLIYFRNAASYARICFDIHQIMSPSMHHIKYSFILWNYENYLWSNVHNE